MSHHFDTKKAQEDPALNICDMYVFPGSTQGNVVMAMTMNADAGISAPDTLPSVGLYVFRFDTENDARENVVFKFRFGEAKHANGDEHVHVQSYRVLRAQGAQIPGDAGEVLLEGKTGTIENPSASGVSAFAGVAPDLWAADAVAFFHLLTTFFSEDRFNPDVFLNRQNFFQNRNVMALILEVPSDLIGRGNVHVWSTASLYGHAPETQISRWGLPLFTHLFLSDPVANLAARYHASSPDRDRQQFEEAVAQFTARMSSRAGTADSPDVYGKKIAARLCPVMLPYEIGTQAAFTVDHFNGRPLNVDAYDVMLTLAANRPINDGVSPNHSRILPQFPYYGGRFTKEEQVGMRPISRSFYRT
jgi:hypothetical protein